MIPNKNFIINRINKITIPEVKQLIIANANNSQYNLHKINNSNNKGCNENRNIEKTNAKETVSNTTIKCKEEKSTDSQNNKNIKLVKNSNIIEQKNPENLSNKKEFALDLDLYNNTIKNYDDTTNIITDKNGNLIQNIPHYPILIGKIINENYYKDIFRYLYVYNNNLDISRYSIKINNIKNIDTRDNKKRDFRKKVHFFYLDDDNILYKKILIKDKNKSEYKKIINENGNNYVLLKIPETLDIIKYLFDLHKEDGHRGIVSLREYIYNNNIHIEGSSYLTEYIIKCCNSCAEKNKTKYIREPSKQIITYYPKQRYIMDLTEIPIELKSNCEYNYLFNIIDHFSKFGISIPLINKEAKTILNQLKIALECNGFPEEIGCDNGKEFKNNLLETYLKNKNIKLIHGLPYNPHSQGVVERFHKTIKDYLYSMYCEDKDNFNLKESIDIIIKKYNNHIHRSTKYTPNEIFYSKDEELFSKVVKNLKSIFKSIGYENMNFKEKEKCLLKCNFKIKKAFKETKDGILIYDKVKSKIHYSKLNVIVLGKSGSNYRIKFAKNYPDYKFQKEDTYLVDYKLLNKCSLEAWNKLLNESKSNKSEYSEESFESNESITEEEIKFIIENNNEFN